MWKWDEAGHFDGLRVSSETSEAWKLGCLLVRLRHFARLILPSRQLVDGTYHGEGGGRSVTNLKYCEEVLCCLWRDVTNLICNCGPYLAG